MRTRAYSAARPGIVAALESFGGGGGYDDSYNDTLRALASVDYQGSGAMLNREKTRGEQIRNEARLKIPGGVKSAGAGAQADAISSILQTTENPNVADYTKGLRDLQKRDIEQQALDLATGGAGNDQLNRVLSVLSEKTYEPYAVQDGMRLNTATGSADVTPVGQSGIMENLAQAAAHEADAYQKQFQTVDGNLINLRDPAKPAYTAPKYSAANGVLLNERAGDVQPLPPEARASQNAPKAFEQENKLRDEYTKLTQDFRTVQDAYSKIQATSDTGAGDMSLLYAYVKLLDPGSVVRESEFATAAASGSFGDRVQGAVQRILTGQRLPPDLRQQFLSEASSIYTAQKQGFDRLTGVYTELAKSYGLNPQNVMVNYAAPDPNAPGQNADPAYAEQVRAELARRGLLKP